MLFDGQGTERAVHCFLGLAVAIARLAHSWAFCRPDCRCRPDWRGYRYLDPEGTVNVCIIKSEACANTFLAGLAMASTYCVQHVAAQAYSSTALRSHNSAGTQVVPYSAPSVTQQSGAARSLASKSQSSSLTALQGRFQHGLRSNKRQLQKFRGGRGSSVVMQGKKSCVDWSDVALSMAAQPSQGLQCARHMAISKVLKKIVLGLTSCYCVLRGDAQIELAVVEKSGTNV